MNVAERSFDVTSCGEGMSSFDEEAMVDVGDRKKVSWSKIAKKSKLYVYSDD